MAIAAAVIRDGSAMSTTRALIDVAAECGGATACDGEQDLNMRPTEPPTVAFDESQWNQYVSAVLIGCKIDPYKSGVITPQLNSQSLCQKPSGSALLPFAW